MTNAKRKRVRLGTVDLSTCCWPRLQRYRRQCFIDSVEGSWFSVDVLGVPSRTVAAHCLVVSSPLQASCCLDV